MALKDLAAQTDELKVAAAAAVEAVDADAVSLVAVKMDSVRKGLENEHLSVDACDVAFQ